MGKLILVTIIAIAAGLIFINPFKQQPAVISPPQTLNPKEEVLSEQKTISEPLILKIPKIGVNSNIEYVGLDKDNKMDVPKNADNVAWYQLGYKVGENGNAVIAGHLDKVSGAPAVFYNLNDLNLGDEIIVIDKNGQELKFKVTKKQLYEDKNFPIQEVFGSADKPMLNLITCEGSWNQTVRSYSHRLVVFSELIE